MRRHFVQQPRLSREIATALAEGREPRALTGLSQSLADCAKRLSPGTTVEPLLGQIRAAWRTAGVLTAAPEHLEQRREYIVRPRWRLVVRDSLITLRANLTRRSTACRHALRLAATLSLAAGGARVFEVPRGYWLPLTIALVLKPDFHDTFVFSAARVGGTVLGAAGATAIAHVLVPGPAALMVLVLGFVWGGYALAATNYVAFTFCITEYVVFLMTLAGVLRDHGSHGQNHQHSDRRSARTEALSATWPTWTAVEMRPAVAAMLEEQSRYLGALLSTYAHPAATDIKRLDEIRASARLARSNSEAIIERTLSRTARAPLDEAPYCDWTVGGDSPYCPGGAGIACRVGACQVRPVPGIGELAQQVTSSLLTLAAAVRQGSVPLPLPPIRETQLALEAAINPVVRDETDLIVDSLESDRGTAPEGHDGDDEVGIRCQVLAGGTRRAVAPHPSPLSFGRRPEKGALGAPQRIDGRPLRRNSPATASRSTPIAPASSAPTCGWKSTNDSPRSPALRSERPTRSMSKALR